MAAESWGHGSMVVTLKTARTPALDQSLLFWTVASPSNFTSRIAQAYGFIADILRGQGYGRLKAPGLGVDEVLPGLGDRLLPPELTRPIAQYAPMAAYKIAASSASPGSLPKPTPADILALAELDALDGMWEGPPREEALRACLHALRGRPLCTLGHEPPTVISKTCGRIRLRIDDAAHLGAA